MGNNYKRHRGGNGQFRRANHWDYLSEGARRYGAPIISSLFAAGQKRLLEKLQLKLKGGSTQIKTKEGTCIIQDTPNTEYKDTVPAFLRVGKPVGAMNPFAAMNFLGRSHRFENKNSFKASHNKGLSSCTWIDCRSFTESFNARDVKKSTTGTDAVLPISYLSGLVGAAGAANTYDRSRVLYMGNTASTTKNTAALLRFSNCMTPCIVNYFPVRGTSFDLKEYDPSLSAAQNTSPCHINYERGSMKFDITSVANHPVNHCIYMFTMDREFCDYMQLQSSDSHDFDSIWEDLMKLFQKKYFSTEPGVPVFGNQANSTGSSSPTQTFTARGNMTAQDYVNAAGPVPDKFLKFIASKGLHVAKVFEVKTKAGQRSTVTWRLGGLHVSPAGYSTSEDQSLSTAGDMYMRYTYYYPGSCIFLHRQWGERMAVNVASAGSSTYLGTVESGSTSLIDYTHVEHMSLAPTLVQPRINAMTASPDLYRDGVWPVMNPPVVGGGVTIAANN